MANAFSRKPVVGGDSNTWAPLNDAWNRDTIGELSSYMYDDSGALKITAGRVGIDDGITEGISVIDTITTIDISGVASGNWAKIEMTVSGTTVTFAAADIAGATDPAVIPTDFLNSYDGDKGGYYITATKRVVGIIWKGSGGVLDGIINAENGQQGYTGFSFIDAAQTKQLFWEVKRGRFKQWGEYETGDWNMTASNSVTITHGLPDFKKIRPINSIVRNDADSVYSVITLGNVTDGITSGFIAFITSAQMSLSRTINEFYDNNADYDATSYNRGFINFTVIE